MSSVETGAISTQDTISRRKIGRNFNMVDGFSRFGGETFLPQIAMTFTVTYRGAARMQLPIH